ncbi:hypothetical protein VP01_972g5 [Puccinia sorghi]|uniref:Uncharacterized protein n=1 Tax=Puccinia sorghi TaxID=27349 RepID=A0A0L6U5W7_9BASI|nr:hypothetical protein VP01_972g5 [Puccinia sorghi]
MFVASLTTGHLPAELYNRPLFYFSSSWIQYFFHSSSPNNNPPLFLALTISYDFKWEQISSTKALKWKEDKYARCF